MGKELHFHSTTLPFITHTGAAGPMSAIVCCWDSPETKKSYFGSYEGKKRLRIEAGVGNQSPWVRYAEQIHAGHEFTSIFQWGGVSCGPFPCAFMEMSTNCRINLYDAIETSSGGGQVLVLIYL